MLSYLKKRAKKNKTFMLEAFASIQALFLSTGSVLYGVQFGMAYYISTILVVSSLAHLIYLFIIKSTRVKPVTCFLQAGASLCYSIILYFYLPYSYFEFIFYVSIF